MITKYFILVRKPANSSSPSHPGIGRRVDNQLTSKTSIPYRFTNNNNPSSSPTTNTRRANLITMIDNSQQKENKFKQIFDQSTVDLSKKKNFFF